MYIQLQVYKDIINILWMFKLLVFFYFKCLGAIHKRLITPKIFFSYISHFLSIQTFIIIPSLRI